MADREVLRLAHAELIPWLVESGLQNRPINETIEGHCNRLVTLGVPLKRMVLGHFLLHPLYSDTDYVWDAASGETVRSFHTRDETETEVFRNSPFFHAQSNNIAFSRYRLIDGPCDPEFPVFARLRDDGISDYCVSFQPVGMPAPVHSPNNGETIGAAEGVLTSFATNRTSGFSDADLALIQATAPALAFVVKADSARGLSAVMLDTYLGAYSGQRVLEGRTQRGDHDVIASVIWLCDLRHSTRLSDTLSLDAYLDLLNDYFECAAGAVIDHGGEVLKFIGDAVLAIFPIDSALRRPPEMTRAALAASGDVLARIRDRNAKRLERGEAPIEFGVSLHIGEVAYGNVGLPRRLDFTVIGPSVNVVARLQDACKTLDVPVVASQEFAEICETELLPLGEHHFRGVEAGMGVYTLSELQGDGAQ